jgi:hypothetical protein
VSFRHIERLRRQDETVADAWDAHMSVVRLFGTAELTLRRDLPGRGDADQKVAVRGEHLLGNQHGEGGADTQPTTPIS